jgi:hypothetical protein
MCVVVSVCVQKYKYVAALQGLLASSLVSTKILSPSGKFSVGEVKRGVEKK